ncbi:hypothetical protein E1180_01330 [Roseibium denhamense]|uniref:Uncharacterized protein n=1 Tax=Roseibium denhamense TaxID=76305 RepID=A0ABY1NGR5_9HYPH|nr:hypothetical protein [Roseibium denhamense]MTI04159.1 hypothetical protein [Roseibium denhamense]SMP07423.1 hypothetical protein SAMN06265374_0866 [Roseibium denhamense]
MITQTDMFKLTRLALAAAVFALSADGPASAQSVQPRGIIQPGTLQSPTARQQLNQNLNRQRNGFSSQQRIDSNNRLNRSEQINRDNMRATGRPPCPAGASTCRN